MFRGYSHRPEGHRRTGRTDYRRSLSSHRRYLLEPLRHRYGSADVFLVTYAVPESPDWERAREGLVRDYRPDLLRVLPEGPTQRDTAVTAIDAVIAAHRFRDYALVVMTRFDLTFKKCPLDHGVFDRERINFLWREWNEAAWEDHRRVPDCVHLVPGRLLSEFRTGLASADGDGRCLHTIWLKIPTPDLWVMDPTGFTDSNTDVADNPVYEIVR